MWCEWLRARSIVEAVWLDVQRCMIQCTQTSTTCSLSLYYHAFLNIIGDARVYVPRIGSFCQREYTPGMASSADGFKTGKDSGELWE